MHRVGGHGFWMDRTEVTAQAFAASIEAIGHTRVAERNLSTAEFPDAPPESLPPGSAVYVPPKGPVPLNNSLQWWRWVNGTDWRHPEGPESSIENRDDQQFSGSLSGHQQQRRRSRLNRSGRSVPGKRILAAGRRPRLHVLRRGVRPSLTLELSLLARYRRFLNAIPQISSS